MSEPPADTAPVDREARRFSRPRRTREGQAAKRFREELIGHVGGRPSATQRAMIDQAVQLKMHLAVMDRRFAEAGAVMSTHDSRVYLAWANSLGRLLRQLGLKGAAERAPSLAELMAGGPPSAASSKAPGRNGATPVADAAPLPSSGILAALRGEGSGR